MMSDTTIDTPTLARTRLDALEEHIRGATDALLADQQPDGHWVFELEADATIPAEYVLMVHYFAEQPNLELERKIGVYLRRIQGVHGGWPLFHEGAFDMSASVKAYFALKMIGDDIEAPHMRRAREAILSRGGAVKSNVFTRALLSLYGVVAWNSVPVMPVEIMLLPRWFPFHLDKISYWARTVIVPLLVLQALKPKAINPRGITIDELFHQDPKTVGPPAKAAHQKWSWFLGFRAIDIVLRAVEPFMPKRTRKRAIDQAVAFVTERLNGIDGLGAIYPAMENSREDVCGARLSAGSSASRDRARIARQAAGHQGGRGLLPALRLAGVGHRAGRPCAARGRRREGGRGREQGARLAQAVAGARREGRLDRAASRMCARAAGRSSTTTRTTPTSTIPPSW